MPVAWRTHDGRPVKAGSLVACWDLDSTVRSTMQRRHLLPKIRAGQATWDDYSLLAADDVPIPGSVALMRMLENVYWNFAVSGTSAAALDLTRQWAKRHDVPLHDYLLRPAGDTTENGVFKVGVIRQLQDAGLKVVLFLEDWEPAARYITEQTGVPVLGINPFDADAVTATQDWLVEVLEHEFTESSYVGGTELAVNVFRELKQGRKSL